MRSRAPGILGLTYRTDLIDDGTAALLKQQIARIQDLPRHHRRRRNATLLSAQAPVDPSGWDVLQEVADDARSALIFGVQGRRPGRPAGRPAARAAGRRDLRRAVARRRPARRVARRSR